MPREKNPTTPSDRKTSARETLTARKKIAASAPFVSPEQRAALISQAAYFRAERRGFAPGSEQEDWLAAEAEVDAKLLRGPPAGDNPVP